MAQPTMRTVDHDEIKEWIEARGGRPSILASTRAADGSGLLRVDFGEKEEELEQVSWDDFFRIFDENDLAFVYEEERADGETTTFCKFVARTPEDELMLDEGDSDVGEIEEM